LRRESSWLEWRGLVEGGGTSWRVVGKDGPRTSGAQWRIDLADPSFRVCEEAIEAYRKEVAEEKGEGSSA
jgi:hypothetical protein